MLLRINNKLQKKEEEPVPTFADRRSGHLPVPQLVVYADDQHIVPWNRAGSWIQVVVFVAPPGRVRPRPAAAPDSVTLEPDLLQEVFQPGHEQRLTAVRGRDRGGVAGDREAELGPRVLRRRREERNIYLRLY